MGGFPEVVLEKDKELKIRILREYIETIFFKDLIERYRIRNQMIVRELIRYLATNVGSIFSLNSFYNWLKTQYPITRRTLINYLDYLEDIGLFAFIRKISYSLKEQAQTLRKCYIIDNGIRYAYGFRFSEDIGKTLENSVFLELKRRKTKNPFLSIFYWRDAKGEADFVLMENTKVVALIQVCSKVDDFKTKEREISSLLKASEEFNCKDLLTVTLDYEGEENIRGKNIKFLPFWLWAINQ